MHLALENPDTLVYDQTDVHPAPVNHKASWKAVQSTLKRHLLVTAQIESIDQVIVPELLLCALSQPKLGLSLLSRHFFPAELNGKYPLKQVTDVIVSVNNI